MRTREARAVKPLLLSSRRGWALVTLLTAGAPFVAACAVWTGRAGISPATSPETRAVTTPAYGATSAV